MSWVAVGALAGCYVYRPLDTVEPRVGARVSADLTDGGSDTLARYVGPGVTSLRGGVLSAERAAVTLAVTSVMDRSGQQQFWKGEPVRVPRAAIRDFAQRRLSLGRLNVNPRTDPSPDSPLQAPTIDARLASLLNREWTLGQSVRHKSDATHSLRVDQSGLENKSAC